MSKTIEVTNLVKVYRNGVRAVDGISFFVDKGEIFGFLGPNGAGKSTTIKILIGLVNATEGKLLVNGIDITKHPTEIKTATGYASQETAIDDRLTAWENITLQGHYYHLTGEEIRTRSEEILKMFDLYERRNDLAETFSGGMLKRLDIAEALIHRPQILFLDEPTLGLDVQTRQVIWTYIKRLREEHGMTIFLTTHYMEEADTLCDRVTIIDRGTIKAIDSPEALKAQLGGDIISISFGDDADPASVLERMNQVPQVLTIEKNGDGTHRIMVSEDGERIVPQLFSLCEREGITIDAISLKKASLDDVYLHHTGHAMRDADESKEAHFKARMTRGRARRR